MRTFAFCVVLCLSLASPLWAQSEPETHDISHQPPAADPPTSPDRPHDESDAHSMDHEQTMDAPPAETVENEPPPEPPHDHAADGVFDPEEMERAREQLRREHGGSLISKIMLNLGEYRVQGNGEGGYRWDGEGRLGGNINRLVVKSEGEGGVDSGLETAEFQGLYSRAISPFFDVQAGVRQDFEPTMDRTYATIGLEGLAPYWFNAQAALFVSDHGDVLARAEGSYDIRLFQRFVLQPRAEIDFSAQDVPETEVGSGLSSLELGLRLRYELRREFAPYIGFSYDKLFGDTADFARDSGDGSSDYGFVVGLRAWF